MRQEFELHPADGSGVWESNDARYRMFAKSSLAQLLILCEHVKQTWPYDDSEPITDEKSHTELWSLCRTRDQLSDSVRLYSAMSVEGFINLYGVVRLGEHAFNDHFDRMGLVPKCRALLRVCNAIQVPKIDPIIYHLDRVAQSRNTLVHPKVRLLAAESQAQGEEFSFMPAAAQQSVDSMEAFYNLFSQTVPQVKHFIESRDRQLGYSSS